MTKTFGETKSLFWNLVSCRGTVQDNRLFIDQSVSLAEVTVEYLIVRAVSDWAVFMAEHGIIVTDFWDMTDNQALRFQTLAETVYPSYSLCIASLITMVNFCSNAYRQEQTIEKLLQRQVFRFRSAPQSGLLLTDTDARLAIQSYFLTMYMLTTADAGLRLLQSAVNWVKSSLSTVAVQITFLRPAKVPGLIFKTLVTFLNAENVRTGNNWLWLRLPVIN